MELQSWGFAVSPLPCRFFSSQTSRRAAYRLNKVMSSLFFLKKNHADCVCYIQQGIEDII